MKAGDFVPFVWDGCVFIIAEEVCDEKLRKVQMLLHVSSVGLHIFETMTYII